MPSAVSARRLRIAVLAHVRHPIAEPFKGGMEAHSWALTKALLARGHDVTLLASADSDPDLPLLPITPTHYETTGLKPEGRHRFPLQRYLRDVFREAGRHILEGGFDVVHNNTLHHRPLYHGLLNRQPTVTSLHVPPFWRIGKAVPRARAPWLAYTVTSRAHMAAWWPDREPPGGFRVVHNGLDPALWPYRETGDGSAVWVGRISHNKGAGPAAEAARRAGIALDMIGPIEDATYFAEKVAPHLGGGVRHLGLVKGAALAEAVGRASVLLFTPMWDEPFGLVAIEAMACGVPIAAFDAGAAREVIGPCGVFVAPGDVKGLAAAIPRATALPREAARARVLERFSMDAMLDGYEAAYHEAIGGRNAAAPSPYARFIRPR
ncbi:MAG: glycosyltransferase [Pseudomonadota bacterium]